MASKIKVEFEFQFLKLSKMKPEQKFHFFRVIKFRRIFDLFLIRFGVLFCERITLPGFTVISSSIHLKVLECIFLGGFVFFVFIFVDGLANRGHNRGRNHLYYYKPGFIIHQLVLEISLSSSLIIPTLSQVPCSLHFRPCSFVTFEPPKEGG